MATQKGRRLSVSTWSLHRTLGQPAGYGPGQEIPERSQQGISLLELPAKLNAFGIHALGLDVLAWNPDSWREQQAMIALGVDGVSSNRPDILLEGLGRRVFADALHPS